MSVDKLINLLVTITLLEMMIAIGLGVTIQQVKSVAKDRKLLIRAIIANYLMVPMAAVILLIAFHAPAMAAAGFLIAAVCPGAPYGPPFTAMSKGNVPVAVGLMVILAGSSALIAPILLHFLLPIIAGNQQLKVDVLKIVTTLLVAQLIPLCIGLAIRAKKPQLASKLETPAKKLSTLLNLVVFGFILYVDWKTLTSISTRGYLGMSVLVLATLVIGWAIGGANAPARRAMAASTSVRNVGVALVIATGSFPGTAAVTSALGYAIFQTILLALLFLLWGKVLHPKETPSTSEVSA
jgi:bile acid:Na+ symporter, BASS family